ncbi:helix-turn-helix domain-containing protein [Carnobacterium inhibens]|uniref:helix-turn-helix domain-containing protein n=1 Tax=Carnobacterium inhibens TaxID=147709 RepID=UPI00203A6687|nr:helix-turn-helix transcriptional regulator [Carnobacterium inhibens]MCM3513563.1 helix-turn-helix domain-containing protein [Carnobacterium inhibens]
MELGEKIKNERKKRNISQQKIADYLNISRQAVSRWENNVSLPDLTTLVLIAKYFEIPLESFTEEYQTPVKDEKESENEVTRDEVIKKATPYILVLTAILTMVLLLPSKMKIPILFFGSIFIIFFTSCLLIYYIIKNYLSSK